MSSIRLREQIPVNGSDEIIVDDEMDVPKYNPIHRYRKIIPKFTVGRDWVEIYPKRPLRKVSKKTILLSRQYRRIEKLMSEEGACRAAKMYRKIWDNLKVSRRDAKSIIKWAWRYGWMRKFRSVSKSKNPYIIYMFQEALDDSFGLPRVKSIGDNCYVESAAIKTKFDTRLAEAGGNANKKRRAGHATGNSRRANRNSGWEEGRQISDFTSHTEIS